MKSWSERKSFISNHVVRKEIIRRTSDVSKRNNSFDYNFTNENGILIQVCKKIFLTTLGFKENNISTLMKILHHRDSITSKPAEDFRGKKRNNENIEDRRKIIQEHIQSFQLFVSHYRRQHAPNRRYLPNNFNITEMFEDFIQKKSCTSIKL